MNARRCFFVSDLHGSLDRLHRLWTAIRSERPGAVFIGGDILPAGSLLADGLDVRHRDFVNEAFGVGLRRLRDELGPAYPEVFVILGNDDPRFEEPAVLDLATEGLWNYVHGRHVRWAGFHVYGYGCVPPTPFLLKDWERYDVSRYVDPGCVSPEEGWHSVPVAAHETRWATMTQELALLVGDRPLDRAILLLHAPPYRTGLDRAALDGRLVEHVPVDVHVGSLAVRRFIEARQPLVTLHGHVHESARLTGIWREQIGSTVALSAAHDGPELALVRFSPDHPDRATRALLS